jgi:hypothetical protein
MRRSSSRLVFASVKIEVHSISTLTVIVQPIYIRLIADASERRVGRDRRTLEPSCGVHSEGKYNPREAFNCFATNSFV